MQDDQIRQEVVSAFNTVFEGRGKNPPRMVDSTVLDASLGLESLDFAQVVVILEDQLGIDPFADGVPPNLRTLGDLIELYCTKLA